jgi:predicted translin family RNA/ssDNA-binding protein
VAETLDELGLDGIATKRWLHELADAVGELPRMMVDEGVPRRVVEALERRVARAARTLSEVRP